MTEYNAQDAVESSVVMQQIDTYRNVCKDQLLPTRRNDILML